MRLAVQGAWVADNLKRLGSGAFYHLAYAARQVDPELLAKLRSGMPRYGRVDIFVLREDHARKIGDGELIAIHWFPEFIRVHFMIGNVFVDTPGPKIDWEDPERLVLPSQPPYRE